MIPQDVTSNLDAGLPNITGEYSHAYDPDVRIIAYWTSGALEIEPSKAFNDPNKESLWMDDYGDFFPISFDASRCSPVYGKSVTVQPSAASVNFYIRAR